MKPLVILPTLALVREEDLESVKCQCGGMLKIVDSEKYEYSARVNLLLKCQACSACYVATDYNN